MSVTTTRQQPAPMAPVLQPQNFSELVQFAKMAANSTMVPKDFIGKPENIMLAVQLGSEVGLSPMQALNGIAVINGRPAIWGDATIGLVRQSSVCEDITETLEGEGESMVAVCIAKRRGASPVTVRFSVADAKKAGLWNKQGPWSQYPARMLQMRARGFALRDSFADVLKGLKTVEELRDYPEKESPPYTAGPTITATAAPAEVPAMDEQDVLRDRVDRLIQTLASCTSDIKLVAYETKAKSLLADIDAADRDDLKAMAVDALVAARARFAPAGHAYAEDDA